MDALIGRRWRWPLLIAGATGAIALGVHEPGSTASSTSALESELDAEFTATHAADHERLALQGAGDAAGAARAAAAAQLHRARYWTLERILASDREVQISEVISPWHGPGIPAAAPPPPATAFSGNVPIADSAAPVRAAGDVRPGWDLYRARRSQPAPPGDADAAPTATAPANPGWGMYGEPRPRVKRTNAALAPPELPQTPFFVYRDPNPPRAGR
jgi:hypothetical protein